MSDRTAIPANIADIDTRLRIGDEISQLRHLVLVGPDGEGPVIPGGEALNLFDRLVELALTVGASLAHKAAADHAKATGQRRPEPGDYVATGAELASILAVATTAVAGFSAAVRGDDDMPDLAGLLDPAA